MKTFLAPALLAFLLAGCVSVTKETTAMHAAPAADPNEMKIAFDVTDGNTRALMVKLATIDLTRKQLIEKGITPKMVIAFRGDASYYTQSDLSLVKEADRADALQIQAKMRELRAANGIESLEQCNVPLASRKLDSTKIIPEVKLVPNGWIALVGYQQRGYSYIVP
jgi:intracellular sulfur oxidation DsrE/DsrF family protein